MQLGMIGLGRMGANMVRRLLRKRHQCVVFNRSPKPVKDLVQEGAAGSDSLADFAKQLAKPRAIWLMVPAAAVDQGFAHAWVTIIDTHVTTIVSAAILFIVGSGPVKGFAVTLTFGLLANLFTAVFVSRVIFDWHIGRLKSGELVSI